MVRTPPPLRIRQVIHLEYDEVKKMEQDLRALYVRKNKPLTIPQLETVPKGPMFDDYKN